MTVNPTRLAKKEYLNSYIELKIKVSRETERAGFWREQAYSISAYHPDETGVVRSSLSNFHPIDKYLENAQYCSELADRFMDLGVEIENAIDKIPDENCRNVLSLHYLDGKTFLMTAKELHFSPSYVHHLHLKGLDLFEIPKDSNFWQL